MVCFHSDSLSPLQYMRRRFLSPRQYLWTYTSTYCNRTSNGPNLYLYLVTPFKHELMRCSIQRQIQTLLSEYLMKFGYADSGPSIYYGPSHYSQNLSTDYPLPDTSDTNSARHSQHNTTRTINIPSDINSQEILGRDTKGSQN